ncbi:hypothetical protein CHARACLAT_033677 [Characodon lateralis]|uniref:Uncharacterized protein n=1 Tax=Characodon lateralis TaxID=208331 RepID=A0ABU7EFL0_9TELE|nr:hypothetical protein [Characodon lateralis]
MPLSSDMRRVLRCGLLLNEDRTATVVSSLVTDFMRPHFGKSNTEPVLRNLASSLLTVAWEMGGLVGCLALKSAAMSRLLRSPDINTISIRSARVNLGDMSMAVNKEKLVNNS